MRFAFTKMQGAGNDFIVVEGEDHDWSRLAPELCHRNFGAGADGILVALPSGIGAVRMRMYNPDGTEDDCGNGLRCLALFARRRGLVEADRFRIETLSGLKEVQVSAAGSRSASVTVRMGRPVLEPSGIPARFDGADVLGRRLTVEGEDLEIHSLFTGTAHTVLFETPDEERFQRLSPRIEHHPLFPERTSVLWTETAGNGSARVRIWERGVGETLACGTGAAAVAVASHLSGRAGSTVEVHSRGGVLRVEIAPDLSLTLTGPAALVYEGHWETGRSQRSR